MKKLLALVLALVMSMSLVTISNAAFKDADKIDYRKARDTPHCGKQTLKQLMRHGTGVSNIEITDANIKAFESTAKKYGIDFALKKADDRYLVFFKGRDADVLTAAFREFSKKKLDKERKPSVRRDLAEKKAEAAQTAKRDKVKNMDRGIDR